MSLWIVEYVKFIQSFVKYRENPSGDRFTYIFQFTKSKTLIHSQFVKKLRGDDWNIRIEDLSELGMDVKCRICIF